MSFAAIVATQLTTPETRSMSVFIGGRDCTSLTKYDTLVASDSGQSGTTELHLKDIALANLPEVHDQAVLRIVDHSANEAEAVRGIVVGRRPSMKPMYSGVDVVAEGISSLLDATFIPAESRPEETMRARIGFLWGKYAGSALSGDLSDVSFIGPPLIARIIEGVSLRVAIEQAIAEASPGADYDVDALGRLHVFLSETNDAPYVLSPSAVTDSVDVTATHDLGASGTHLNSVGFDGFALVTGTYPGGEVWRSIDLGASWTNVGQPGADTTVDDIAFVASPRAGLMYAGCSMTGNGSALFKSTDSGATWTEKFQAAASAATEGFAIGAYEDIVVIGGFNRSGGTSSTIWRSTDAGENFSVVSTTHTDALIMRQIRRVAASTWIAGVYSSSPNEIQIYRSTDDGATWASVQTIASTDVYAVAVLPSGSILLGTHPAGKVYRSTDVGATFSEVADLGLGPGQSQVYGLTLVAEGVLAFANRNGNAAAIIYFSDDDGATWAQVGTLDTDFHYHEPVLADWRTVIIPGSSNDVVTAARIQTAAWHSAAGFVSPQNLEIDYDGKPYANRVYIQGGTPAGSGFFQREGSIASANGIVKTAVVQAPETETASLAQALANMYLGRVSGATARGSFLISSPYDGWRKGQNVRITNSDTSLTDEAFRIAGVTTRVLKGGTTPQREYFVEFGGSRASGGGSTSGDLGVGQLVRVPFNFSGSGILDSDETFEVFISISERINVIAEAKAWLRFREFWAPATAAAASGDLTSNSGGGSTSGSSSSSSSGADTSHTHFIATDGGADSGGTSRVYAPIGSGTPGTIWLNASGAGHLRTGTSEATHTHTIAHTHSTPNHQHTTPTHTHSLTYGIFKETIPASWSVTLNIYQDVSGSWDLAGTISSLTSETEELDLAPYITAAGLWRLEFQSAAAQPNNGRLAVDVAGQILGAIASI